MTKNVSLTAGNKDGVANKRTHGVGEWMRLATLIALTVAFCMGVQRVAFAAEDISVRSGVIIKECAGTAYGKHVVFEPGRAVTFDISDENIIIENHSGVKMIRVASDGYMDDQLLPLSCIAMPSAFKKVEKWTGDKSAGCEMVDASADHKITRSGATTSDESDENGTEVF